MEPHISHSFGPLGDLSFLTVLLTEIKIPTSLIGRCPSLRFPHLAGIVRGRLGGFITRSCTSPEYFTCMKLLFYDRIVGTCDCCLDCSLGLLLVPPGTLLDCCHVPGSAASLLVRPAVPVDHLLLLLVLQGGRHLLLSVHQWAGNSSLFITVARRITVLK